MRSTCYVLRATCMLIPRSISMWETPSVSQQEVCRYWVMFDSDHRLSTSWSSIISVYTEHSVKCRRPMHYVGTPQYSGVAEPRDSRPGRAPSSADPGTGGALVFSRTQPSGCVTHLSDVISTMELPGQRRSKASDIQFSSSVQDCLNFNCNPLISVKEEISNRITRLFYFQ